MNKNARMILAIAVLALAALACQTLTGGSGSGGDNPSSDTSGSGKVILRDDFSSEQWGTGTDSDSAVEYIDSTLNFNVFTENYFVWSTPDDNDYGNIHMEVTAINNGTDSTTAFGLMCNKSIVESFYYFAITPAGQYAIAKASVAQKDVFLTNNDEWANSDLINVNADSYRVGVDCGNGKLTLYVDGKEIASVNDSSYMSGRVAVVVWSAEDVGSTNNVSFDDFVMTELP